MYICSTEAGETYEFDFCISHLCHCERGDVVLNSQLLCGHVSYLQGADHNKLWQDLMTNPLIVPLKILREHKIVDFKGVLDAAFHPTQPWIFTAGGDATVCLCSN